MKLNKEKIGALLALDDAHLWQQITSAAQKFGYTLPGATPKPEDMAKIRTAMNEAEKLSAMDVAKLLATYKAKRNKE